MSSKSYFNEVADQWDAMRQDFFSESVRIKAFEVAGLEKGKLAADLGAGTGFITQGLLQYGLKVIAVDQSQAMLDTMQAKFLSYDTIEYRLGDAEALPIQDSAVDYALSNMFLHHVGSPATAIREMARILKPGGKLVLTDLDQHNFEFLRSEHFDRWMGFDRADIKQWFTDAGLKDIRIDCVGSNCCASSSCGCESASISIFVASGTK